jgi:hypothetical protein
MARLEQRLTRELRIPGPDIELEIDSDVSVLDELRMDGDEAGCIVIQNLAGCGA